MGTNWGVRGGQIMVYFILYSTFSIALQSDIILYYVVQILNFHDCIVQILKLGARLLFLLLKVCISLTICKSTRH